MIEVFGTNTQHMVSLRKLKNNNRRITNRGRMSNPRRDFIDDGELNSPFNNQYPHMH